MKCKNCESENIKIGVTWGTSGDTAYIGLKFAKKIMWQIEQVRSDLCLDCGEINRIYVNQEGLKEKKWLDK